MKLLITGGAGFIGSHFIRYIINKYSDYKIVNLDSLTYAGNLENLHDLKRNHQYKFRNGSITDKLLVEQLFEEEQFDVVVNFAAESHVDRSIFDAEAFVNTNVFGTYVLLEAAKRYKIKKFVQISTDEVYGSLGETGFFTESTSLAPNSPYSASKASADLLVRAYHETFSLPVNITRCSNNYGPFQHPEKLIPLMIHHALNNKNLPVYGNGYHIRDWLHVEDHCYGIDLVLHKGQFGEVYNIGGNNERRNIDIVKCILDVLQKPYSLITYVNDRLGHDKRYAIDATKIKKELGWEPKYTFDLGIKTTIDWYIENQDWVNNFSKIMC